MIPYNNDYFKRYYRMNLSLKHSKKELCRHDIQRCRIF